MIERILDFSIRQRWLVLLVTLAVGALGAYNYQRLPIDAVPDITNVQVQINTEAPGYSPLEAEQRITFPVETAMAGLMAAKPYLRKQVAKRVELFRTPELYFRPNSEALVEGATLSKLMRRVRRGRPRD